MKSEHRGQEQRHILINEIVRRAKEDFTLLSFNPSRENNPSDISDIQNETGYITFSGISFDSD